MRRAGVPAALRGWKLCADCGRRLGGGEHSQFRTRTSQLRQKRRASNRLSRPCPPAAEWQGAGPGPATAWGALSVVTLADGLAPSGHVLWSPGHGQVFDSLCVALPTCSCPTRVTTAAGHRGSFPGTSLAGSCLVLWVLPGQAQSRCPWGNSSLTEEDAALSGRKLQSAPSARQADAFPPLGGRDVWGGEAGGPGFQRGGDIGTS